MKGELLLYEIRYESVEHWMIACEGGAPGVTLSTRSGNCLSVAFSSYKDLEEFATLLKERCLNIKTISSKSMQTIQLEIAPRNTRSPTSHITVPRLVGASRDEIHEICSEDPSNQDPRIQSRVKSPHNHNLSEDNIFTEPQHVNEVVYPPEKAIFGPLFPEAALSRKVNRLRTRVLRGFMRLRTYDLGLSMR